MAKDTPKTPDKPADKGKAAQGKEAAPPAAGEIVVSFDKINEIANDRKATGEQTAAKDKSGPDKPAAADKGKAAQDKEAAPPAHAAAKGKDAEKPPASTDKGRISSIEFPSGKKLVIEDAAKPQDKAPAADKQAKATDPAVEGDTLDDWKREEQAAQAKKPRQRKATAEKKAAPKEKPLTIQRMVYRYLRLERFTALAAAPISMGRGGTPMRTVAAVRSGHRI